MMINIYNNLLFNALWCIIFLSALIAFFNIVRKKKFRIPIWGVLLLSIRICYHAALMYFYYRMLDSAHSDVIYWHRFTVITSSIQELITAVIIGAILICHIKQMAKIR